jgi:hypothetical protein
VRLAGSHAACDLLGLESFNEDHLYGNLDWLTRHQARIENRLGSLAPSIPKRSLSSSSTMSPAVTLKAQRMRWEPSATIATANGARCR